MDPASELFPIQELARKRRELFRLHPEVFFWWRRPCTVRTLLVTDGGLDFGMGDFGLQTFVNVLVHDGRSYVRFELTLAHLRNDVTDAQVMTGAPGVARSLKGFRFDEPTHFAPDMYDEVWLFGIETNLRRQSYADRIAQPAGTYPASRLGDAELAALSGHMNRGGGVFATGDHGDLGNALCGSVNRVRSMRRWGDFVVFGENEVGMINARRNDTNQIGHDPGSQFSDQSDDVPQLLDLKLYSTRLSAFRSARYPHPVLCGRSGRIDVFPDHPHEGECIEPTDLTQVYAADGSEEYPVELGGGNRVAPEVIATSRVPAGNDARGSKFPTQAHRFGAVSAYDGHRAGVGRVVCDATWHHFVNVNLIGVVEGGPFDEFRFPGESPTKHDGFLSSAAGQAALARIQEYYVNVGVWIAPPSRHACFHSRHWLDLVFAERIMEASLLSPDAKFETIPSEVFRSIGIHARDVLGRRASQCQTLVWTLDWLKGVWPEIAVLVDPWAPWPPRAPRPPLPWYDLQPWIDVALGGALVAVRQALPYPPPSTTARDFDESARVAMAGARRALGVALREAAGEQRELAALLEQGARSAASE